MLNNEEATALFVHKLWKRNQKWAFKHIAFKSFCGFYWSASENYSILKNIIFLMPSIRHLKWKGASRVTEKELRKFVFLAM